MCNIQKLTVYNVTSFVNRRNSNKMSEGRAAKNFKRKINTKIHNVNLKQG